MKVGQCHTAELCKQKVIKMGVKINHFFSVVSASEDDLFHFYSVVSDRSVLLLLLISNLSPF